MVTKQVKRDYLKMNIVQALALTKDEIKAWQKDLIDYVEQQRTPVVKDFDKEHEYLCRAFAAYYSDVTRGGLGTYFGADEPEEGFGHGIPDFLMSYVAFAEETGRSYVMLSNSDGKVFAFYRIGNQGQLRRLVRLPKELQEQQ